MAFMLSQASDSAGRYPRPLSPAIRESFRRAVPRTLVSVAVATFCWGLLAFWLIFQVGVAGELPPANEPLPSVLLRWGAAACGAVVLLLAVVPDGAEHRPLVLALGYAEPSDRTLGGHHSRAPGALRYLGRQIRLTAAAAGCIVAAALTIWWADVTGYLLVIIVSGAIVIVVWVLLRVWRPLRAARRQWLEDAQRVQRIARIRAEGPHAIAVVQSAEFAQWWLDDQPVFRLSLVTVEAQPRHFELPYSDYRRWAPRVGDEFDLWVSPGNPASPDDITLERRLSASQDAANAEPLRRPSGGESAKQIGVFEPKWASVLSATDIRRHRVWWGICTATAGLAALGIAAAAVLYFGLDSVLPRWVPVMLLILAFIGCVPFLQLFSAWASPRRFLAAAVSALFPGVAVGCGALLITVYVVPRVVALAPEASLCLGVAAVLSCGSGLCLAILGAFSETPPLAVALRRRHPAPCPAATIDEVHQVIASGDARAPEMLVREHQVMVGGAMAPDD